MLANERKQLKQVRQELLGLCEEIDQINIRIVEKLKNANDAIDLGSIELIQKDSLYKRTNDIDNEIVRILALYSPEARDLRELIY